MRPDFVGFDRAVLVEGDLVDSAVTKIADEQVALSVEFDAIHTVLILGVLGEKCTQNVGISQCIGDLDVFLIQAEAVYTADQLSGGILDQLHFALGQVNITIADSQAIGVLHIIGDYCAFDHSIALDAQP